ncbi:MAG: hypothetical protein HWE20_03920 [Gammaproteobacteria bacterium]|nr:hypothetical protein [Gammaproteobacteria bacterium]
MNIRRTEEIFYRYYKEAHEKKSRELLTFLIDYAANLPEIPGFLITIDEFEVDEICFAYYLDIIRYKDFHQKTNEECIDENRQENVDENIHSDQKLDLIKICAFSLKWVSRNKPLTYINASGKLGCIEKEYIMLKNHIREAVAIDYALSLIPEDVNVNRAELMHFLKYRNVDDRSLMLYFDSIISNPKL